MMINKNTHSPCLENQPVPHSNLSADLQNRHQKMGEKIFDENDIIEVFHEGVWHITTVKYDYVNNRYKTAEGLCLLNRKVKKLFCKKLL